MDLAIHPFKGRRVESNRMSEAIDTDQSVALIVTKVTIDTDRWQVSNGKIY